MYWWTEGPGRGNFGDLLGPLICEHLSGRRVVHSSVERADLISIGSLLEPWFWKEDSNLQFTGAIWGTGRMEGLVPISFPSATICAVRGKLSRERLGGSVSAECTIGEPGLLTPMLVPATLTVPRRFKVGVVPHWGERKHEAYRKLADLSAEILIIDPCERVAIIVDRIRSCDFILSSSLHGLILADAFGLPRPMATPANRQGTKTRLS